MKVLLINPPCMNVYWSMPKVCKLVGSKALMPPLGLLTVAALLPQDWHFRLVDMLVRDVSEDDWRWADIVMITGMITQRPGLLAVAREAKERGKTVVAGGAFVSSQPEMFFEAGCDFVVVGEGESTMPALLDALTGGEPKIIFSTGPKPDLGASPIPRFDLLRLDDYASMGIQTSRGCPFDCEFCYVKRMFGAKIRYKSPARVIEELDTLFRLGWRRRVFVSDDNFIGSRQKSKAILDALIPWHKSMGEPFSFVTQASINLGRDLELIDLMTAANFSTIFLGIESSDEGALQTANKAPNLASSMEESLETIKRNGLAIVASFIIGLDGETKGAGKRIEEFVTRMNLPLVMINLVHALPGTRLWDRLSSEGRLIERPRESGEYYRTNVLCTRPESEIMQEFVEVWTRLFDRSRFLTRAENYFLSMRPTRQSRTEGTSGPEEDDTPPANISLRLRFHDVIGTLRLLWWAGIRGRARVQFWRQALEMKRQNPSRIMGYFTACASAEDLFALSDAIRLGVEGKTFDDDYYVPPAAP